MERDYIIYRMSEERSVDIDFKKVSLIAQYEDGLHEELSDKLDNKRDFDTVKEHIEKFRPDPGWIAMVDERECLETIEEMSDLKHSVYMYMPGMEYVCNSEGGLWDWEALESKIIEDDGRSTIVIRVSPRIGMPFAEEFTKHCVPIYVWTYDMTKLQAIVYYYREDRKMSFKKIAECLRRSQQNIYTIYKAAREKEQMVPVCNW